MNDLFAWLYEHVFKQFNVNYNLLFQVLFDNKGYINFVLSFTLIPLFLWGLFYYFWRYPYGKFWHWFLWLLIVTVVVSISTWRIANGEIFASNNTGLNDALADPNSGYQQYASTLPLHYAFINSGLSLIAGVLISFIMKQFSKVQTHLPL